MYISVLTKIVHYRTHVSAVYETVFATYEVRWSNINVINAPAYASMVKYTNCTNGHFQLLVSRFTVAMVLMHCMANT